MSKDVSEKQKCARCATQLSWIGLWDSFLLMIFKGAVGIFTGSRALIASALYSFHDVLSGVAVLVGLKIASRPPDEEHPYGHGNAEYIVCVFTSILILGATIFILADCVRIIFLGEHARPHWATLVAAAISVLANELIYRFNICAHKHINSPALLAHGKHHRADVIASLAVVVATLGSMMGYLFLDALVAVFEAGHLIFLSIEIFYQGSTGLIDGAIIDSDVRLIRQALAGIPEVRQIKAVKTRQIGRTVWVDLYVCLPPERTIAQVSTISTRIQNAVADRVEHLGSVNVICE
ncbi:MAG TPA: cation diffusion facilitator family transporter [Sedimentisphaerales bacterium]|nr:cation diffusion facilitator family transporter [Sedimentisphaerales bacterium]